tara:strand:- start:913 stop:1725 length:813 start_codon:yes stop_codon:yes gene_type:complete
MVNEKVSVLMTIYNHENYLKSSILSLLKQNYKNWELIAIENGSKDKSRLILKSFKDKRIKKKFLKKNIGRTKGLNFGLKFCKSKYIAVLDSDDISHKNRLFSQVMELEKDKNLGMVFTNFDFIDENSNFVSIDKKKFYFRNLRELLIKNFIGHSTVMYRKDLLKRIGNYPPNFKYAQDYAFYLKIFRVSKIKFLDKKLVKIRAPHDTSETKRILNTKLATIERIKILYNNLSHFEVSIMEKLKIVYLLILEFIKYSIPNFMLRLIRFLKY